MKTLNPNELKSIEQIFQLRQPSLLKAMTKYLESKYNKVISTNEYVVAVGNIPVALTAHLDTVFKEPPQRIFYDRVKNVMWSPEGLGADDRAGVYAIIQIVKSGMRPTIILTTDEELGCNGAEKMVKSMPKAPAELKYIIELDRRGSDDCVFYQCNNPDFENYIESFGFVMNFGSFSDISVICPAWGVAGVNLSIGYYNEHSFSETLYVGQMLNTINKVKKMLADANEAPVFDYREYYASQLLRKGWLANYLKPTDDDEDDLGWDPAYGISKEQWMSFMEPQTKCHDCGTWDYDYNLFPTKGTDGTVFFCCDCISKRQDVHWCATCGEPFVDSTLKKGSIYNCKDCGGNVKDGSIKPGKD